MTVIAMTREMGTLGKDVAAGLADKLGLRVVHHELVEHHLAERLQVAESTVHRFLEGQSSLWERWQIDSERMSRFTSDEVLQLAADGDVIIRGWGAAQLLRDISHVMCVRICAPMEKRVREMRDRLGVSDDRAMQREIERSDDAHSRAVQRQFSYNWRDAENYDIVLNTGFVSIRTCIDQLAALAKSEAYRETEASRGILADKSLEAEVRRVLDAQAADTPFGSGLNVLVSSGEVTLAGVVSGRREIDAAVARVSGIEGVNQVINDIQFVPARSGV